jgi:hypothetical protein
MTETIQLREWHQDGKDMDVVLKHHKGGKKFTVTVPGAKVGCAETDGRRPLALTPVSTL